MAKLINCGACGNPTSRKAEACPQCGEPVKKKKAGSAQGCLFLVLIFFGFVVWLYEPMTEEERLAASAQQEAERIERKKASEQKRDEDRLKGFHCLSGWDGSHAGVEKYVVDRLRDPDSYEHIETRITKKHDDNTHTLYMEYRARNGFGGMTNGRVTASIKNDDCTASILVSE